MSSKIDPVDAMFVAGYNSRQKDVDWLRAEIVRLDDLADDRLAEMEQLQKELDTERAWREELQKLTIDQAVELTKLKSEIVRLDDLADDLQTVLDAHSICRRCQLQHPPGMCMETPD